MLGCTHGHTHTVRAVWSQRRAAMRRQGGQTWDSVLCLVRLVIFMKTGYYFVMYVSINRFSWEPMSRHNESSVEGFLPEPLMDGWVAPAALNASVLPVKWARSTHTHWGVLMAPGRFIWWGEKALTPVTLTWASLICSLTYSARPSVTWLCWNSHAVCLRAQFNYRLKP